MIVTLQTSRARNSEPVEKMESNATKIVFIGHLFHEIITNRLNKNFLRFPTRNRKTEKVENGEK